MSGVLVTGTAGAARDDVRHLVDDPAGDTPASTAPAGARAGAVNHPEEAPL